MTEAIIAQKVPYEVEVEAGQSYLWCACGRSAAQPFCDGSHKGTGLSPVRFDCTETGIVFLCGCKRTGDQPYCDGSHERLG